MPVMPETAPVDPVNSGRGTETGRNPTSRRRPGTDSRRGSSQGLIGTCGAERRRSQVEVGGDPCHPLPQSKCHAGRPRPGKRPETVVVNIKANYISDFKGPFFVAKGFCMLTMFNSRF